MALLSLIFQRSKRPSIETSLDGVTKTIITMDVSISETHSRTAVISQNEIEDGSNVADHVKLNPEKLTIEGLVSDSPVGVLQSAIGAGLSSASQLAAGAASKALGPVAATAVGSAVGLAGGSIAGLLTGQNRNPKDMFKLLDDLWRKRQPFTMVTALEKYDNMIITDLTVPRSASIGKSLRFTMSLEKVQIVSSSIVQVPAFKVANAGGSSVAKLGKQASKTASAANGSNASLLLQGFQKFGFLGGA